MALSLATALAGAGSASARAAAAGPAETEPRLAPPASEAQQTAPPAPLAATPQRALLDRYCVTCHNERRRTGGLALDALDVTRVGAAPELWERVVLKLRGGMMPPAGRPRPAPAEYDGFRSWLEAELDRAAESRPDPGRVPAHRLNRAEYANAVRDLLALEIDGAELLPADDVGHGFDNLAGTLALSPALMERYLSAARRISRLAVGDPTIGPGFTSKTYVVPINMAQNDRMSEDLPFGSRAGLAVRHRFPLDGEYAITIRLQRSVYEYIVNLDESHDLDVRIDGRRVARFAVGGEAPGRPAPVSFSGTFVAAGGRGYPSQAWDDYRTGADAELAVRVDVGAGTRVVGVSFAGKSWEHEGVLQPPLREYGATVTETTDTSSRPEGPGVGSVAIDGPYRPSGPGQTASRARIFLCRPGEAGGEAAPPPASLSRTDRLQPGDGADGGEDCARTILARLARRAFRRPVGDEDLAPLLTFYRAGRAAGGFEAGIQMALERLLIDPEFLFRIERDPEGLPPGAPYRLADLELASRLSFFLWSSIPDDELLDVAAAGRLSDGGELERQVRRMLADPRAGALVENFAGQWLALRSVDGLAPDPNLFPEFDENLREALRRETDLFLESQLREDRSVVDLLRADYTFLNERLARHYGVPGVTGNHFRRVRLSDARRAGLLGHGSVLAVTSYGNRTSPVLRAKWLLENVLGSPPSPPPPDIPPLPESGAEAGEPRTVRERLARHRRNAACAICHAPMDPLGFALENFDALGGWRTLDAGVPIDASAVLADGATRFDGPAGLREVLLERSGQFVETVTEKLLTYALGRGIEHYDRPVIRAIARSAAADDHRWSSLILGIARSTPFRMRRTES
ncbi:MAG: DUF1592 domain-containing protein [Acidobacteria bacterium]|nr:DUF1592 domain-containing protein [Acidobacteriota bacterium]